MKCTACNTGSLVHSYIEGLFPCHTCSDCGGNLVMLGDFLRWQDQNENAEFVRDKSAEVEAQETVKAMICPITGGLMTKYKISKDTDHRLDLSPTINAVWMDKGEWALLKNKGLAGSLSAIFTDHWQQEIHSEESADMLSALYQRNFGEHYDVVKAFRATIEDLPIKSQIIAYLMADDPYDP